MKKSARGDDKKYQVFLERLVSIYKQDRSTIEGLLSQDLKATIRVNRLKVNSNDNLIDEFTKQGWETEPLGWYSDAFFLYSNKDKVSHSQLFANGQVALQNASSLIPPLVLEPQPGELVLDMCAAPGGKSAQIAALTNNQAHLWINDLAIERIREMKKILTTQGVKYDFLLNQPAQHLHETLDKRFDKVLLDAPCSTEGLINLSRSDALQYWSLTRIKKSAELQNRLIDSAYHLLKAGGTLVYATCTFAPEENELVIDELLQKYSDIQVSTISLPIPNRLPGLTSWQGRKINPALLNAIRVIPTPWMEGFFVCKLVKN